MSAQPVSAELPEGKIIGGKSGIGYLLRWNEYATPEALYQLQDAGLLTRVSTGDFAYMIDGTRENFTCGTILIPASLQDLDEDQLFRLVSAISEKTGLDFYGLTTGLSPEGFDMGSNSFARIHKPEILMFIGGSSRYGVSEVWHLLDQVYRIPVTLAPTERFRSTDLDRYDRIILPGGSYREWSDDQVETLKEWVRRGGILIALEEAARWAAEQEIGTTTYKETVPPDTTRYLRYADREEEYRLHVIGGSIFRAKLDLTHPLCYGYVDDEVSLMKRGTVVAEPLGIKYLEPVKYAEDAYVSGWVSEENLERIRNAPVVSVQSSGSGKLISFHESVNFRGIWLGTNKLLANAIFFPEVIR